MSVLREGVRIWVCRTYPEGINAYIDGAEVEYHDYVDVSIGRGGHAKRASSFPVLRDAETTLVRADRSRHRRPRDAKRATANSRWTT